MDTTLENQKVRPIHILSYGFVAEMIPIGMLLLYVYGYGRLIASDQSYALSQAFMEDTGFIVLLTFGFFSFLAISFWIAKKDKHKTFLNGILLVVVGIVLELLFYWIINVDFRIMFIFSFLGKLVGVMVAGVTPTSLKGTKDRRPDDDHDHKSF